MNSSPQESDSQQSWNIPSDVEQSIPDRFAQQVGLHAKRTAILSQTEQLTYEELDRSSNGIARSILEASQLPRERVVLLGRHDVALFSGAFGILKAGKTAVVLNPSDPVSRLNKLVDHADARLLIADAENLSLAQRVAGNERDVLCINACGPTELIGAENPFISPADIAFLVYTSGSSGEPKGVIRSHRSLLHNSYRHACGLRLQPGDRLMHLAALSGGSGVSGACTTLLSGATFCTFPMMERGVNGLADWIDKQGVTVIGISTSLFRNFMRTIPEDRRFLKVKSVRLTAEPVTADDLRMLREHFSEGCEVVHTLSSSETGAITRVRFQSGENRDVDRLAVGKSTEDVEVLLLDENDEPVSVGETGEIVVRSRYLADGYWRNEKLTQQRFSIFEGVITFRSGDLGRINFHGHLEYAGRKDARIKVRGYRIEPSEIEDAIRQLNGVREAVVQLRSENPTQLVAWYTCHSDEPCQPQDLRRAVSQFLPYYMIPNEFVMLQEFPIAANGKIDRAQLRSHGFQEHDCKPPRTETERRLAEIWETAFQCGSIGSDDHFFELGGDSLIAAVMMAYIDNLWGIEISLQALQQHPVLSDLAQLIDRQLTRRTVPASSDQRKNSHDHCYPLSIVQETIWNECQHHNKMAGWTSTSRFQLQGELLVETLTSCLHELQRRHEILRTTYEVVDGAPVAIVHPAEKLAFDVIDFSSSVDPEREATRFYQDVVRNVRLNFHQLPLMRFWLLRLNQHRFQLHRINHHILSDSLSWKIYFDELKQLYEASLQGREANLPAAPQYSDYAIQSHSTMNVESPRFRQGIDWWKQQLTPEPPELSLPFQRPTPCENAKASEGIIFWEIVPEVSGRLNEIAAQNHSTCFSIRLAAFAAALAEVNKQDDLLIGSYSSGRRRLEYQQTFGIFTNTVIFRLRWDSQLTFGQWARSVSETVFAVQEHDEIPYQLLCRQLYQEGLRIPSINALACVSNNSNAQQIGDFVLKKAKFESRNIPWGFTMLFDRQQEDLCYTSFDPRIYEPARVRAFLRRYLELLDRFSKSPYESMQNTMRGSSLSTHSRRTLEDLNAA